MYSHVFIHIYMPQHVCDTIHSMCDSILYMYFNLSNFSNLHLHISIYAIEYLRDTTHSIGVKELLYV